MSFPWGTTYFTYKKKLRRHVIDTYDASWRPSVDVNHHMVGANKFKWRVKKDTKCLMPPERHDDVRRSNGPSTLSWYQLLMLDWFVGTQTSTSTHKCRRSPIISGGYIVSLVPGFHCIRLSSTLSVRHTHHARGFSRLVFCVLSRQHIGEAQKWQVLPGKSKQTSTNSNNFQRRVATLPFQKNPTS